MLNLLDQLHKSIGADATRALAQRFDLQEGEASQVLPTVAPAVLGALQNGLQDPQQREQLWPRLLGFFQNGNGDLPPTEGAKSVKAMELASDLLGPRFETVTASISSRLGVPTEKAAGLVQYAAPMVLSFLKKKANDDEPSSVLTQLVGGEALAGLAGLAGGKNAGAAVLGKVGSLFGGS